MNTRYHDRCRGTVMFLAAASLACAPAPRSGEEVHIAEESAIIIWDAVGKTQHFIRRASFETKAKDFGFLVPTPTVPKLEEAEDGAFDLLKRITAPVIRQLPSNAKSEKAIAAAPAPGPAVVVVAEAKVAGYDAVVLEASDADALNQWLKEHGYASSPELVDWFKPYIAQRWRISAFKIARGPAGGGQVSTKAVRMSFQTDKPFFPYREPASQRQETGPGKPAPRLLRVYFLGDARFGGSIGAAGSWPGTPVWSNTIDGSDWDRLLKLVKLPPGEAAAAVWLTEFEDRSSPRPGTDDVYFSASADQEKLERAPVYEGAPYPDYGAYVFWMSLLILAGVLWLAIVIGRRIFRK